MFFRTASELVKMSTLTTNLTSERDDAVETIKTLTNQQSESLIKLDELKTEKDGLHKSLVQTGKVLDETLREKEEVEEEFQRQLLLADNRLEEERKKWNSEKSHSKQHSELLQQSSEAALYKLQGERQQISAVKDQLVEQKGLVERYKHDIENLKRKFQDENGDRTSLEKRLENLKQNIQKSEEELDQLRIEKDMWKSKYDELVSVQADKAALQKEMTGMIARLRDSAELAEEKENEVEKLKREKIGIIHLLIYMRSYLVKYADLRQSLEIADKERELDLKEREALVYRADSLQREFGHISKLLQV
jgi:chromosome segregation ATPase